MDVLWYPVEFLFDGSALVIFFLLLQYAQQR